MPDPLCRVHDIAVVLGQDESRADFAQRLFAPYEADRLRSALGITVRQLRGIGGLSQEQLGFAAGLHRNYVGAIERARSTRRCASSARSATACACPSPTCS